MSLLPTPTFSGANPTETFYVRQGAPQVTGVASVNGLVGALGLTSPDNSISVLTSGQNLEIGTTGNAIPCASVTASGNVTVGGNLAVTGSATAGSLVTSAGFQSFSGLGIQSGLGTISAAIPDSTTQPLTALNTILSTLPKACFVAISFVGVVSPANPSGLPTVCGMWSVPAVASGTSTGAVPVTGAANSNLNTQINTLTSGAALARLTTFSVTCGAGGGYSINAGSTYYYTIFA